MVNTITSSEKIPVKGLAPSLEASESRINYIILYFEGHWSKVLEGRAR
jgi:hypothetical protein